MDNINLLNKILDPKTSVEEKVIIREQLMKDPQLADGIKDALLLKMIHERIKVNEMKENINKWKIERRRKLALYFALGLLILAVILYFMYIDRKIENTAKMSSKSTSTKMIVPIEKEIDTASFNFPKESKSNLKLDTSYLNQRQNEFAVVSYSKKHIDNLLNTFEQLPEVRSSDENESKEKLYIIDSLLIQKKYLSVVNIINQDNSLSKFYTLPRLSFAEAKLGQFDQAVTTLRQYAELVDDPSELNYELLILLCHNPKKNFEEINKIFEQSMRLKTSKDYVNIEKLYRYWRKYQK